MANVKPWTPAEIKKFRKLYPIADTRQLSKQLGRSMYALKHKAAKLQLLKDYAGGYTPPRPVSQYAWKAAEIELLRKHFTSHTYKELATLIGRSADSIKNRAAIMGLSRQTLLR